MEKKKSGHRKTVLTILQGLLLLVVLSTLFSMIFSLVVKTLFGGGVDISLPEAVGSADTAAVPEAEQPEDPAESLLESEEILNTKIGSPKQSAVAMYSAFALLFLLLAWTKRQEWKYNLYRYGAGAVFFAGCAVVFLTVDPAGTYLPAAVLHALALAADHIFAVVGNHRIRSVILRALGLLLLGLGFFLLPFGAEFVLIFLLMLTLPRVFYYIARIAFSRIRMDVLRRIVRKTYAAEILFGMLLMITAFSIALPVLEESISNFGDALWYCFAIVTTIGFGDFAAVTLPGRIISVILGCYGIIVVALITSIIVNFYNETKGSGDDDEVEEEKGEKPL